MKNFFVDLVWNDPLASRITTAINQRAEARLVALDVKVEKGLLAHLHSISFRDKVNYQSVRIIFIKLICPGSNSFGVV